MNLQPAGIVVCGGQSRRMGRPKEWLPFGPETMLQRVVRLLGEAVRPVVVVGAGAQKLPELPDSVAVLRDRRPDRGPLEGIAVGLTGLAEKGADAAFVVGCDVPLLKPAFVTRMFELAAGYDVVVPHVGRREQPLDAVYRVRVTPQIEALLAADRLRPRELFELVRTRRVAAEELRDVDPALESLANVNCPTDYQRALEAAGLGVGDGSHGGR